MVLEGLHTAFDNDLCFHGWVTMPRIYVRLKVSLVRRQMWRNGMAFSGRAFLCYTQGVFQQPLIFVSRLKGQGETHLLLQTIACFRVNKWGIVFLSGQDYCLSKSPVY